MLMMVRVMSVPCKGLGFKWSCLIKTRAYLAACQVAILIIMNIL